MTTIGLLGAGGIARAHAAALQALAPRAVLDAVYDIDTGAAAQLAATVPGLTAVESPAAFWDRPLDAVLVTVPNHEHAAYVETAAARGLHVFCEKPLGASLAEAERMLAAVEKAGVVHMIGFKNRYAPAVEMLRTLLADGGLGTVFHYREVCSGARLVNPGIGMEWRMREERAGGGAVADFGSHTLDMASWLLADAAGPLIALDARLATFIPRAGRLPSNDDLALLTGRFASGALFEALDSRVGPGLYQIEVYGQRGRAAIDMTEPDRLTVVEYGHAPRTLTPNRTAPDPFQVQMTRFLDAIRDASPADPGFHQGVAIQRWIEAARQRAR